MRLFGVVVLTTLLSTAAVAAPKTPEALLESFLSTVQAGKYDGALQAFFAGSLALEQKAAQVKAMEGQVKAAFEFYGPPTSWEMVETKKIGKDLVAIKLISKQKGDAPLFWNALFYRRNGQWEPLAIFFFDDPKQAGFW